MDGMTPVGDVMRALDIAAMTSCSA